VLKARRRRVSMDEAASLIPIFFVLLARAVAEVKSQRLVMDEATSGEPERGGGGGDIGFVFFKPGYKTPQTPTENTHTTT